MDDTGIVLGLTCWVLIRQVLPARWLSKIKHMHLFSLEILLLYKSWKFIFLNRRQWVAKALLYMINVFPSGKRVERVYVQIILGGFATHFVYHAYRF